MSFLWKFRWYRKLRYAQLERKYAYEVVRDKKSKDLILLYGPIASDTLRFSTQKGYEYVQIVNEQPKAWFRPGEILLTDKIL